MSVAVLENIPPMLAVARAMTTLCRELVMIADNHSRLTKNVEGTRLLTPVAVIAIASSVLWSRFSA